MARRRNQKKQEETLVDLVEAKEQAQDFIGANQNLIFGGLVALVVLIGGFYAYRQFYQMPREQSAQEEMAQAQIQFARDSFALALTNPGGGNPGFLDIIENYGGTKAANVANFYAGVSYLNIGNYEIAIDYLKDFDEAGDVLGISKYGAIADAYGELQDFDSAISNYKKAVKAGENEFLESYYLKKLGMLYEKQGQFADAESSYEKIRAEYPDSPEARDIDKYIARASAKK